MVIRGFKKCGVSAATDGSEDNKIHIKDLEDYDVESNDDDPFVSSESEDGSERDCSSDIHSSSDDGTIVLSSESDDDSQVLPKLSVPFDSITNPERFSPFTGGFIDLTVRDTPDKFFTISVTMVPPIVKIDYTVLIIVHKKFMNLKLEVGIDKK